jgi:GcrA cell cycle regulator
MCRLSFNTFGEKMSNRLGHKYTDEEKEFILSKTAFSATQITEMYFEKYNRTITRNAVIGVVHRLGQRLKGRQSNGSVIKPIKKRKLKAPSYPHAVNFTNPLKSTANVPAERLAPKAMPKEVIDPNRPPLHISFMELTTHNCHWPFGADNFTYCGHPAKPGEPYCAVHCNARRDKIYHRKPSPGKRKV